ncbi:MAG: hypothetical protein J6I70_00040 [Bacteroidaceae bacterium]|nr:hypothetical protein [Bacteroidaceae bacterium]
MKRMFFVIMLFMLSLMGMYSQTIQRADSVVHTEHFSYVNKDKHKHIKLIPNEYAFNRERWSNQPNNAEYSFPDKTRPQVLKDHQQMLEKHFSIYLLPMSVEDLKVLRKVHFNYYFDKNSKFLGYEVFVPSDLFERFPSMERLCAEFGRLLKDYDFSVYGIRPYYPDKFKYSYCTIHLANYINLLLRQK